MLADYDVAWFEEALRPTRSTTSSQLATPSPVPIAGGEVLTRRQASCRGSTRARFDIVQPDVTKVGGIERGAPDRLDGRRSTASASSRTAGTPPSGLAADLQLASALPDTDLVEYITGSPYVDEIAVGGWPLDADGMLAIPTEPGLGLTLDPEALARYCTNAAALAS